MKDDLVERLYQDFPHLYDFDRETVRFACGDGWFELVRDLSRGIASAADDAALKPGGSGYPRITQVKEKFGRLRVYFACEKSLWEQIYPLTHEAEQKSAFICETCGEPGQVRTFDGAYVACCTRCATEFRRRLT